MFISFQDFTEIIPSAFTFRCQLVIIPVVEAAGAVGAGAHGVVVPGPEAEAGGG